MSRIRVIENEKQGKTFYESYIGPIGCHLNCLTRFSAVGQRKNSGSKRPGRIIMAAMGRGYDPHKSRFSMSEDEQVTVAMLSRSLG